MRHGLLVQLGGNLDQRRHAGGIVHRAVVDRVSVHGGAHTQVVEVRGEEHVLVPENGIRSGDHADHVRRVEAPGLRLHVRAEAHRYLERGELLAPLR